MRCVERRACQPRDDRGRGEDDGEHGRHVGANARGFNGVPAKLQKCCVPQTTSSLLGYRPASRAMDLRRTTQKNRETSVKAFIARVLAGFVVLLCMVGAAGAASVVPSSVGSGTLPN